MTLLILLLLIIDYSPIKIASKYPGIYYNIFGFGEVGLRMIFKRAIILRKIKENPAQYVEKPRCEYKEMDYLKPDEVKLFLENVDKRYYPLFLTAIMTGLRQGEILALRWGDINWVTSQIHIKRAVSLGKIDTPKSKHSVRAVSMPPMLVSALRKHKLSCLVSEDDLVFPNGAGNLMDARDLVNYYFLPALRRAGLRRIRFHDLRHTYASLMIYSEENLKAIQAALGHSSIQTTLDRYGHLLPDPHNEIGKRLQDAVFGSEQTAAAQE